jgi:hypothetical protein
MLYFIALYRTLRPDIRYHVFLLINKLTYIYVSANIYLAKFVIVCKCMYVHRVTSLIAMNRLHKA